ncbi:MAG: hypothetical protein PHI35_00965 [Victivallaceae bacterium]|nr:hypothetical protein [Victivallaceae bacterium]
MKRILGYLMILPVVLGATVFTAGCAPTITINGQEYKTLSPKEEKRLIAEARATLKKASKRFTEREQHVFATEEPQLNYRFNPQGIPNFLDITWTLAERKVIVMMARNVEETWMVWALRYDPVYR